MAKVGKILVLESDGESRAPFLRGILTRSLETAGLPFDQAHALAHQIRQELKETAEISSPELAAMVQKALRKSADPAVLQRYLDRKKGDPPILVRDETGVTPFSPGQMIHCLQSCALSPTLAESVTRKVQERLTRERVTETTNSIVCDMARQTLEADLGPEAARRYLTWVRFQRSGRPLILLIGGVNGTGKSTVATEIAHRLGVPRTQSTDMLREVMRLMVSDKLLPALHSSSFEAWRSLYPDGDAPPPEGAVLEGFSAQARLVETAMEAVVQRALREKLSLILEGIHLQPAWIERLQVTKEAIVAPVLLAVLSREQLRQQLEGRGSEAPSRRGRRYLSSFEAIWEIQAHLLSEADRLGLPMVPNLSLERTVLQVLEIVTLTLALEFPGDARRMDG